MVALVVVATAFVALLGLHNRNLAWVGSDQDLSRATLLAREFITQMEVVEQFPELGESSGPLDYPGFSYEREVTETEVPSLRKVVLRVIFDPRRPNACELVYYIYDHREPVF
jgi:hypothetical protein